MRELKEIGTGETTKQESSWKQNEMDRTCATNECQKEHRK